MPQFGCFLPTQIGGEGAVGGIENMVALIKDIACWPAFIIMSCIGGIDHHQRMIGDNNIGPFGPPHGFFNKAFVVMLARRMDTFAAPVGKACGLRSTEKICQPGWKAGPGQIAIITGAGPARHQPQCGCAPRLAGHLYQRFLKIEQTQIIFAALAQNNLF